MLCCQNIRVLHDIHSYNSVFNYVKIKSYINHFLSNSRKTSKREDCCKVRSSIASWSVSKLPLTYLIFGESTVKNATIISEYLPSKSRYSESHSSGLFCTAVLTSLDTRTRLSRPCFGIQIGAKPCIHLAMCTNFHMHDGNHNVTWH